MNRLGLGACKDNRDARIKIFMIQKLKIL